MKIKLKVPAGVNRLSGLTGTVYTPGEDGIIHALPADAMAFLNAGCVGFGVGQDEEDAPMAPAKPREEPQKPDGGDTSGEQEAEGEGKGG